MSDLFIALGVGFIVVGILYKYGLLDWFGNLPLDFKAEGENYSFYAPIGSMLLISLVLSLLFRLFR
jgi:di/tricarboxylate transporter